VAIAYASAGAGNGTETSGAQLQLACPATVAANDVLIAHVTHLDITSSPTAPANWDLLYGPANLGTGTAVGRSWVYGKLAIGNEDGVTLDWGNPAVGSGRYGRIYSFSGYSSGVLADLVGGFSDTPTEGTIPLPTVTTSIAGALAVALLTQDDNNAFAAAGAVTGGTWAEPVAEFVSTTIGAQGCITGIQTCTPTADPGTVTGGTANATADEGSTIGFEIRAEPPPVPRFGSAGTQLQTTTTAMNVDVPDSVAADDIIVVTAFVDCSSSDATITALASGFAQAPDSPVNVDIGNPTDSRLYVMWKRATGADSTAGTYDFTVSASVYVNAQAIRYVGAVTSGDPWNVTDFDSTTSAVNDTPAVQDTTTVVDTLLVWAATNWNGGAWTPPTGFTERRDSGDQVCTVADKTQAAAGDTGSIVGTCAGSAKSGAWLGALMSVAAGGDAEAPAGNATGAGAALQPEATVAPNAGSAASSGTANAPTIHVRALAGAASASGSAFTAKIDIKVSAGAPTAAGEAPQPTVQTGASTNAPAGLAEATGTASAPTASVAARPAASTGAGTANTATAHVGVRPNAPTAAGSADGTTVQTGAFTNAPAGLASATGSANAPIALVRPSAGVAAGTGTANQPVALVRPIAGGPTGAGSALQPSVLLVKTAFAGLASGSGSANAATIHVKALAGVAAGAGTAPQPVGQGELPVEPISDPLALSAVRDPYPLRAIEAPLSLEALED